MSFMGPQVGCEISWIMFRARTVGEGMVSIGLGLFWEGGLHIGGTIL